MDKSKKLFTFTAWLLSIILVSVIFLSCEKDGKIRKYTKKETTNIINKKDSGMMKAHFTWESPEGWTEEEKTSSMRLATFKIKNSDQESKCTIIPLKGDAGGLKANILRWLGQININLDPNGNKFKSFLASGEKFLTKSQFPAILIDFTSITPNPQDLSILSAIITVNVNSIFIKMTGKKSHLVENKEKFKQLCRSLAIKKGN